MKPLWVQTLVWIAAVVAAFLLAYAVPESLHDFALEVPHGATAPR